MHCEQAEILLARFVFDEVEAPVKDELLAHVAQCAKCGDALRDLRVAAQLVKDEVEAGPRPVLGPERRAALMKAAGGAGPAGGSDLPPPLPTELRRTGPVATAGNRGPKPAPTGDVRATRGSRPSSAALPARKRVLRALGIAAAVLVAAAGVAVVVIPSLMRSRMSANLASADRASSWNSREGGGGVFDWLSGSKESAPPPAAPAATPASPLMPTPVLEPEQRELRLGDLAPYAGSDMVKSREARLAFNPMPPTPELVDAERERLRVTGGGYAWSAPPRAGSGWMGEAAKAPSIQYSADGGTTWAQFGDGPIGPAAAPPAAPVGAYGNTPLPAAAAKAPAPAVAPGAKGSSYTGPGGEDVPPLHAAVDDLQRRNEQLEQEIKRREAEDPIRAAYIKKLEEGASLAQRLEKLVPAAAGVVLEPGASPLAKAPEPAPTPAGRAAPAPDAAAPPAPPGAAAVLPEPGKDIVQDGVREERHAAEPPAAPVQKERARSNLEKGGPEGVTNENARAEDYDLRFRTTGTFLTDLGAVGKLAPEGSVPGMPAAGGATEGRPSWSPGKSGRAQGPPLHAAPGTSSESGGMRFNVHRGELKTDLKIVTPSETTAIAGTEGGVRIVGSGQDAGGSPGPATSPSGPTSPPGGVQYVGGAGRYASKGGPAPGGSSEPQVVDFNDRTGQNEAGIIDNRPNRGGLGEAEGRRQDAGGSPGLATSPGDQPPDQRPAPASIAPAPLGELERHADSITLRDLEAALSKAGEGDPKEEIEKLKHKYEAIQENYAKSLTRMTRRKAVPEPAPAKLPPPAGAATGVAKSSGYWKTPEGQAEMLRREMKTGTVTKEDLDKFRGEKIPAQEEGPIKKSARERSSPEEELAKLKESYEYYERALSHVPEKTTLNPAFGEAPVPAAAQGPPPQESAAGILRAERDQALAALQDARRDIGELERQTVELARDKDKQQLVLEELTRRGVEVTRVAAFDVPKNIQGKVQAVSEQFKVAVISAGADDGVKLGYPFTLYRGDKFVARGVVEKVERDWAVVRWDENMAKEKVMVGDDASTSVVAGAVAEPRSQEENTRRAVEAHKRKCLVLENARNSLLRAVQAFEEGNYDAAEEASDSVLLFDPQYRFALDLKEHALKTRQKQIDRNDLVPRIAEWRRLLAESARTTIPYADTFRIPDAEALSRINARLAEAGQTADAIRNSVDRIKMALDFQDADLTDILDSISKATGIPINVDAAVINDPAVKDKKVSLRVKDLAVGNVLKLLLAQYGLEYEVEDKRVRVSGARPEVAPTPAYLRLTPEEAARLERAGGAGEKIGERGEIGGIGESEKGEGRGQEAVLPEPATPPPQPETRNPKPETNPEEALPSAATFKNYPVNPWVMAAQDRFSTFGIDVDTASYTLARNYINRGFLPPAGAVRMEEFVNAFDYNYPRRAPGRAAEAAPHQGNGEGGAVFAVHAEAAPAPFGEGSVLVKIGVQARSLGREGRKPAHLVFVVDASGSMARPDRMPLVQEAIAEMVEHLGGSDLPPSLPTELRRTSPVATAAGRGRKPAPTQDRISLIAYGTEARLVVQEAPVSRKDEIVAAVRSLTCGGSTNLLAGLKLGYAVAQRAFRPGEINRVILCSDGVANVGPTDAETVLENVRAYRDHGITFTAVGFGMGAYNDALLEKLADSGDGNYVFVDTREEARRVLAEGMAATLQTVAKDAKIQVEFDPRVVRRYRLIGYENRDIADKDFRNDAVDAGEVGSGQSATALYEVEPFDSPADGGLAQGKLGDLGTVYVRYRDLETGKIEEISRRLEGDLVRRLAPQSAPRFFLAACAAEFAELLRESGHAEGANLSRVRRVLEEVVVGLPLDTKARELLELVKKAEGLPKAR